MARTHTFKGSASAGYGYAAFIEDGQLVITVDWGREGGVLYRGPYQDSAYYVQQLWKEAPKLYNSIVQYYAAQAKKEEEMKVKVSDAPANKEDGVTYRFKDSRDSRGNGYSGFIDEDDRLVLEHDDPRSGGAYFIGSYEEAVAAGHIRSLKIKDVRLFNDIEKYYIKHGTEPKVPIKEVTSSPAGVLWKVKLHMTDYTIHYVLVRGLNEACIIKKLMPQIPEVLTLQTYDARVIAVRSDMISAAEFMPED